MIQEPKKEYDLEERTAHFGERIINCCKLVEQTSVTKPIINQLVRSDTSVGANYCEANNASSKKDFRNKIFICKKESQETKHWLRMLKSATTNADTVDLVVELEKECQECVMIFQKITTSIDKK